jgi:hypothetical protein
VLFAFHLLIAGDKDAAVHALASGVRFSHDVANDGTLFATAVAKVLLVAHLRAIEFALEKAGLSATQRSTLRSAVGQLGPGGLDWQSAMKRELGIPHGLNSQAAAALARIAPLYVSALRDASTLPTLEQNIANAPPPPPPSFRIQSASSRTSRT